MIKVSKFLTANAWIHVWMEPNGTTHDAGDDHSDWAYTYFQNQGLKGNFSTLFDLGWVRLGNYLGSCYIEAKSINNKELLGSIQNWTENFPSRRIYLDLGTPHIDFNFDPEDFSLAGSPQDLVKIVVRSRALAS